MELKWLEDLAAIARIGHFARAAEIRFVTQSALSRRIKALENWAGAELVDRTSHPIRLTPAGEEFMASANRIIKSSYEAQAHASNFTRISQIGISFSCLHTLALLHLPRLVACLQREVAPIEAAISAEPRTIDEYLYTLRNGTCDFFICYDHPGISFDVDLDEYPRLQIGVDRIFACARDASLFDRFDPHSTETIPYLEYGRSSIMARALRDLLAGAPFERRLHTVYRATLAESLSAAAHHGLGVGWLPESLVTDPSRHSQLHIYRQGYSDELRILIFRSRLNQRPIVNRLWNELEGNIVDGRYVKLEA